MKRLSILFLLIFVSVKLMAQQNSKALSAKVIYNAVYNQEKGMKIYPKFNLVEKANIDLLVNTCFYLENGKVLQNFNNIYCCNSGQSFGNPASARQKITADTPFIFIPYAQLNLSPKKVHKIKFALNASAQNQAPTSSRFYHSIIKML